MIATFFTGGLRPSASQVGAGKASDVWSLGCLLFEIVGGIMLFYDDDWIRFFMRVTSESDPSFVSLSLSALVFLSPCFFSVVLLFPKKRLLPQSCSSVGEVCPV